MRHKSRYFYVGLENPTSGWHRDRRILLGREVYNEFKNLKEGEDIPPDSIITKTLCAFNLIGAWSPENVQIRYKKNHICWCAYHGGGIYASLNIKPINAI